MEQNKTFFENFYENSLNKHQREIVDQDSGISIVHAGAGSGKTRIITSKITYLLLKKQVPAHALLALTFTNKAANEMKERVINFLENDLYSYNLPFIGTFHSYCLRLLKQEYNKLEMPNFTIIDERDKEKLLKGIIEKYSMQKQLTPKQALSYISRIKNDSTTGIINYESIKNHVIRDIFIEYEKEKTAAKNLDFDDLLLNTLNLFKTNPEFKKNHQEKIRHILVDEFQDTNHIQHALLKEMIAKKNKFTLNSLCIVGDEDQSIYSWRGAIPSKMISFKDEFEGVKSFTLEQNYRSIQPILNIANKLIKNNSERKEKILKAINTHTTTNRIALLKCVSSYQESECAAALAKSLKSNNLYDFAILYRSHYQSRSLEEALIKHSIPYVIIGGIQFYDRQEIKDLLAYLKLAINPFDKISLSRIINTPARNIGKKSQEELFGFWSHNNLLDFKQTIKLFAKEELLTKSKLNALENFVKIFENITEDTQPTEALEQMIAKSNYFEYLEKAYNSTEAKERIANIKELIYAISSKEQAGLETIREFLEDVALLQEKELDESGEKKVSLMTLHGAKGLEFDTVMIAGLEEGILPSGHSIADHERIEEERRLLYVGITRACKRLLLTNSAYRYVFGQMNEQIPSRFIEEFIDQKDILEVDISNWTDYQLANQIQAWIMGKNLHEAIKNNSSKISKPPKSGSLWQLKQRVHHVYFGPGTIEKIEQIDKNQTYLSIRFKKGLKKIDSRFIKSA